MALIMTTLRIARDHRHYMAVKHGESVGRLRLCSATRHVLLTLEGFEGRYVIVGPMLTLPTTGELHMKIIEEWAQDNGVPDRLIYRDDSGHDYLPNDPRRPAVLFSRAPTPASDAGDDAECRASGGRPRKSRRLADRHATSMRGPYYAC